MNVLTFYYKHKVCSLNNLYKKEKQDPFFYTHKAIGTNNFVQTEITNLSCQIYL